MTSLVTFDVDGVRVSAFVCYDLRFADEFWALAPATDCYVVVANWPAARRHHWRSLLVARAIENQAYVVGVQPGRHRRRALDYAGDTRSSTRWARCSPRPRAARPSSLADVDPAVVAATRERFPFLADRRPSGNPPGR